MTAQQRGTYRMVYTTATCPECRGTGFQAVQKLRRYVYPERREIRIVLEKARACEACDGRGEITVKCREYIPLARLHTLRTGEEVITSET